MFLKDKMRSAVLLIIVVTTILFSFSAVVNNLLALWASDDNPAYSHGLLLVLVSCFIIVREWRNNQPLAMRPSILPIFCLVVFVVIEFLSALGSIQIIQMLVLIPIICITFWAVLGFKAARPFYFPVFLMLGAMPVWEIFGPTLQTVTAVVVGEMTTLTIIPSMREGMFILIPAGTFEVAAGCSGINYLIISVIISVLFCYINEIRWLRAVAYVLVAMLVSIVANIIRIYIIIVTGQMTNMESYFVTVEHISLGWAVFAVGITFYLWLANRSLPTATIATDSKNKSRKVNPLEKEKSIAASAIGSVPTSTSLWYSGVLIAVIIMGPLTQAYFEKKYGHEPDFTPELPEKIAGWGKGLPMEGYRPDFGQGFKLEEALYRHDSDNNIYMYMNYYYRQTQGSEAVNDLHQIADGKRWHSLGARIVSVNVMGFDDVMESRLITSNGQEMIVWQWYDTNGINTGSKFKAKLQNIMGFLLGDPGITVFVVAIDIGDNIMAARSQLTRFLNHADI